MHVSLSTSMQENKTAYTVATGYVNLFSDLCLITGVNYYQNASGGFTTASFHLYFCCYWYMFTDNNMKHCLKISNTSRLYIGSMMSGQSSHFICNQQYFQISLLI